MFIKKIAVQELIIITTSFLPYIEDTTWVPFAQIGQSGHKSQPHAANAKSSKILSS